MKIRENILALLQSEGDLSIKVLTDKLLVSKQAIHLAINKLVAEDKVEKLGRTPKTIYRLRLIPSSMASDYGEITLETASYLKENFLVITEIGKMLEGVNGFDYWCRQRKLPLLKTIDEYITTKKKYEVYYNPKGIIDGKEKLLNTKAYKQIFLDDLFYLDFYAIERFGKTRLGTLLHYAKQGQNKFLMKILTDTTRQKIESLIADKQFDAVGYIPPTIKREVQLMKFIETQLRLNLPRISILKISGIIPVPQKSLNKIEERISNAENTFAINETVKFDHILLIDDAVGSGSTLNQVAGKIKQKGIAKKITGLAIVGSFKGFDVVTDV